MNKPRFLEDIVKEDSKNLDLMKRNINSMFRFICEHPLLVSSIAYLSYTTFGDKIDDFINRNNNFGILPCKDLVVPINPSKNENYFISVACASFLYVFLDSIKNYYLKNQSIKLRNNGNLASKLYNWSLDNPNIVSTAYGALCLTNLKLIDDEALKVWHIGRKEIQFFSLLVTPISVLALNGALKGIKNIKNIKNTLKENKQPLIEKTYNFIFEHPFLISGGAAFAYLAKGFNFNNKISIDNVEPLRYSLLTQFSTSIAVCLGYGLTFTGSFLHSHSLNIFKHKIPSIYNAIFGNLDSAIKNQERLLEIPDSIESRLENMITLGNLYYKNKDIEKAYMNYAKAARLFDKKTDSLNYFDFFRKTFKIDYILRNIKSIVNPGIEGAFILLLNKDENSLEKIKKEVAKNGYDYKTRYLYGRALEIIGFKESGNKQKIQAVNQALDLCETESSDGSKRSIVLFKDELFGAEVLIKTDNNRKSLEDEIETTKFVRELTADYEEFYTAKPIGIIEKNGRFLYTMEAAHGELLSDKVKNNSAVLEDYYKIAEFLALVHANVDVSDVKEKEYIGLLNERLKNFGLDNKIINEAISGLQLVVSNFSNMDKVFNKDAKPNNWIITESSEIVMLDIEKGKTVALPYDCAALFSFPNNLSEDEIDKVIERHADYYSMLKKIDVNIDKYRLAYFSAAILRGFEAYTRKFIDVNDKIHSLKNAEKAIERIREEYRGHYITGDNDLSYKKLRNSIKHLACTLSN